MRIRSMLTKARCALAAVLALSTLSALLSGCAAGGGTSYSRGKQARDQVKATERAFARTMADRDLRAFGTFLADVAVFFSGSGPLRGKQAITESWSRFYARPQAPFSWEPEEVEVLEGGTLALSSGPVRDPSGKLIGHFTSIWRQEAPGQWRIVFDKGSEACDCERK